RRCHGGGDRGGGVAGQGLDDRGSGAVEESGKRIAATEPAPALSGRGGAGRCILARFLSNIGTQAAEALVSRIGRVGRGAQCRQIGRQRRVLQRVQAHLVEHDLGGDVHRAGNRHRGPNEQERVALQRGGGLKQRLEQ